jgi:MscS family membrane protein
MFEGFLSGVYFGSTVEQYLLFFGTILGFIIAGKIVNFLLENYAKRITAKTQTEFDDLLVEASQPPILFLSFVIGLYSGSFFLSLTEAMRLTFTNIVGLLFIVDVAWFLVKIVDGVITHFVVPLTKKTKSRMDDQLVPIISKGTKVVIIALALVIILDNFGYDITAIIAGLGIGGLAVAFAAQQTIADAFGGMNILLSKPFFVGDVIEVEGLVGTVEYIGVRHTHIRDFDGRKILFPIRAFLLQ